MPTTVQMSATFGIGAAPTFEAAPSKGAGTSLLGWLIVSCLALSVVPLAVTTGSFGTQPLYDVGYTVTAACAIVLSLPSFARRVSSNDRPALLVLGFVLAMTASVVVHFSALNFMVEVQMVGAIAIASHVGSLLSDHRVASGIIRVLCAYTASQFVIGVAQVARNGAVLGAWGAETEFGFRRIAGRVGAAGTVTYANVLGVVAAMVVAVMLWFRANRSVGKVDVVAMTVAVGLATALVGLSLSRTALVAWLVIPIVALLSHHRRLLVTMLLVAFVSLAASVLVQQDGWISRGQASVAGVEEAGSGRMALNRQAVEVFKTEPVFGVGLSGYRDAVLADPAIDRLSTEDYVVHNAPLFLLATTGLVGFAGCLPLLAWLIATAMRRGPWGIGMLVFLAPILLLARQLFNGIGYLWVGLFAGLALVSHGTDRRTPSVDGPDLSVPQ
jgi:hypothetical protein